MQIVKQCIVCGKSIKINVDEKGNYDAGHYFGVVEFPIGKGKYKNICTSSILKIGRTLVQVAEWIGNKEKVEYWECNKCYTED